LQVTARNQEIRIRRFRASDMDRLMAIERASFGRWAYSPDLMMAYFRRCPELFLVASIGMELVGYSVACPKLRSTEFVSIAVDPQHRKAGVGKRLLDSSVRRLRRSGEVRLTLMVKDNNATARRFYEAYGFRRVRVVRGYYEDGRDGVLMRLQLS
jgi:[ribosomal protein S18]-alanine N-acetyltransferase